MTNFLITGGAGFIGSNFIRYFLNKYKNYKIINLDNLTYAGNVNNLINIEDNYRYKFIKGSINDINLVKKILETGVNCIINFAAESHVDRSINNSQIFVKTNILGTQVLLNEAKNYNVDKFIQISTDEVYGSLGEKGLFTEKSPVNPSSPYSASKASADFLALSYYKSFGLPAVITRCTNNYGPYQFPEKLIPLMIIKAINNEYLPVYGNGENIRDWIHVVDHCRAVDAVIHHGKVGEIYNIGAINEKSNLEVVKFILNILKKSYSLINFIEDRPGHDIRYAIDNKKIVKHLGWSPKYEFEKGLKDTVDWYVENKHWWEIAYRKLYMKQNNSSR
ncbi:dTDP-glucose 4,6-dehydratase [Abyssisolibacter fermentans]|uniref:dTDP-glucose 4,6-dehydratase n=1 Tax=Abyssisolibacter fermentans TaxID=1766203 RepID=UPI000829EED3|nr:dTDP-glucose 4,6-dehydratase [Abyssisolibacter fermentans]